MIQKVGFKKKQFALLQEHRYYSNNGKYFAQVQRQGDILLYKQKNGAEKDEIIWNINGSLTAKGHFILVIETNGNMKIIDREGKRYGRLEKLQKYLDPIH